jgi:hypothetical protein
MQAGLERHVDANFLGVRGHGRHEPAFVDGDDYT